MQLNFKKCLLYFFQCDFSTLAIGNFLSRPEQANELFFACAGLTVTARDPNDEVTNVNVFNSSDIASRSPRDDPDIGSPNRNCPGGGPGRGAGGGPGAAWPNCEPQGSLLIIQNSDNLEDDPNDSPFGGCFLFEFDTPIEFVNMGLLDFEKFNKLC